MSDNVYEVEVNRQGAKYYYYSEGVGVPQLAMVLLEDDSAVKQFVIPLSYLVPSKVADKVLIGTLIEEEDS